MFVLRKNQNDSKGLDSIIPGKAVVYEATPTNGGIIDVITDFRFTSTPITPYLKNKTPYVILFEYEVEYNSTLASALYYGKIVGGAYSNIASQVTDAAGKVIPKTVTDTAGKIKTFVEEQINSVSPDLINKALANKVKTTTAQGLQTVDRLLELANEFNSPLLTPYNGLYLRKTTQFAYIFPYYNDKKRSISSVYETAQQGLVGKSGLTTLVEAGKDIIDKILGTGLFASPGAFIETPKFYNMPDGESITIDFTLINTVNTNDYINHYNFLFLLTFQNIPYRKDVARIIPPKMYRCIIPGEQEFPFCYIEKMDVDFIGSRRILPVQIPVEGGGGFIDAVIPDAYKVSITVKSLNTSSGNFMLANNNITVTTAIPSII